MTINRQVRLARRPQGLPMADDFVVVELPAAEPGAGQVRARALFISVDPYMRPRLNGAQPLDAPLVGTGLAEIEQSRDPRFREGDIVRHAEGMQGCFVADGNRLEAIEAAAGVPITAYLHALGMTGITAYGGLLEVGALKDGEQVFVSAAAGAVGSVAAQIAKIKGCRVVGSTGSAEKVRWLLDDLNLDAVINHHEQPLLEALTRSTPKGLDVYFENVGGEHLEAALMRMNLHGRIPLCGTISNYNGALQGVRNLGAMIHARVRMQGFVSSDFEHLRERFTSDMTGWLQSGAVKHRETIVDGIERTPEALIGLFEGRNIGKMLVRVAD